ncbi:hypothetical protein HMPREF1341_00846 [Enterococcus faecalis ERV81]|nr:hypothetical protein HMPREF9376_01764 [Enterococcus faecalis S613]EJU97951.1 hypothetical protein HMPREF1330_01576 [Enterococcus faecalis ERV129]EJV31041.1 hypothetical protein HMPREF1341_00846 [Enterococcus faecalis ERV81]EPI28144.1 hypothetical protein D351_01859 [Enterococcus faecalis WKS-26-18-2]
MNHSPRKLYFLIPIILFFTNNDFSDMAHVHKSYFFLLSFL